MSNDLLVRLVSCGAPADVIADVALLIAEAKADREALARRRRSDSDRQARRRAELAASEDVTGENVTSRDVADVTGEPLPPAPSSPQTPLLPHPPTPGDQSRTRARKGEARHLPERWEAEPLTGVTAQIVARWEPGRLERELSKFRDHWAAASGPAARKRDWQAAWRMWITKAEEMGNGRRNGVGGAGGGDDYRNPLVRAAAVREARRSGGLL